MTIHVVFKQLNVLSSRKMYLIFYWDNNDHFPLLFLSKNPHLKHFRGHVVFGQTILKVMKIFCLSQSKL